MVIVALILLGLCFGSFVNALVWRIHEQDKSNKNRKDPKLSITKGRSMCSHCKHPLALKDLIPVFSWISLKGKCRYCKKAIADTPAPEIITALLFVVSYLFWPSSFNTQGMVMFGFWLLFLVGFVALALYDLKWMILPDRIIFPYVALGLIQAFLLIVVFGGGVSVLVATIEAVLVASGIFYILFQVSKGRWIGGGDVKLGLVLGLVLADPIKSFVMIFVASVIGSILGIPMLIHGKDKLKTRIPFGPLLIVATIIVYLFGASMISYYKRRFLYL
jgi:prepilin signal peptidase PulO-like enzyme (type II secretory pathway)